jgi:hypothetical protein
MSEIDLPESGEELPHGSKQLADELVFGGREALGKLMNGFSFEVEEPEAGPYQKLVPRRDDVQPGHDRRIVMKRDVKEELDNRPGRVGARLQRRLNPCDRLDALDDSCTVEKGLSSLAERAK